MTIVTLYRGGFMVAKDISGIAWLFHSSKVLYSRKTFSLPGGCPRPRRQAKTQKSTGPVQI